MPDGQKLINDALLEKLSGPVETQKQAVDALTDCLRVFAREQHYNLPYHCPLAKGEPILVIIEGVPLYTSDLRRDADVRETLIRRVKLYNVKDPNWKPPLAPHVAPGGKIDDVFVTARYTDYAGILYELSGVGPWHHTGGHGAPRADTVINFQLFHEAAQRDFRADVTLSDDRRTIKVEFK